jgi:hypothetical protein
MNYSDAVWTRFIEETFTPCTGAKVRFVDAYDRFTTWCEDNHVVILSKVAMSRGLAKHGLTVSRYGRKKTVVINDVLMR